MGLPHDLLGQARHLATLDRHRPRQASLRRAISTAYYAAFHLLLEEGAQRMTPKGSSLLASRVARAFGHGEMKQVCRAVQDNAASYALRELIPKGFSSDLRLIASTFILLQDARHRADYDTGAQFFRIRVEETIDLAEGLFQAWERVRATDEANIFCAALLLGTRWAK